MAQEKKYWSSIDVGSHSSLQRSELEWEVCENPWVLSVLSSLLEKVVASNQRFVAGSDRSLSRRKVTVFDGLRAPDISIHSYIQRIFKYANCSKKDAGTNSDGRAPQGYGVPPLNACCSAPGEGPSLLCALEVSHVVGSPPPFLFGINGPAEESSSAG
eukprot:c21835_g2_i1 orf=243-716(+)